MENPLISIIIPVFNTKAFLKKCIHSLLVQDFKSIEIILIDDGSTDGTSKLCHELSFEDDRIIVIHSENKGASYARNTGLGVAKGSYIAFVDSDDWVTIDYLTTLYRQFELKQDIDLAIVGYMSLDEVENNPTLLHQDEKIQLLTSNEALINLYNPKMYKGYLWNKLFRKDIIQNHQLKFDIDINIWEDMLFCCKYLRYSRTVSYSNKTCYFYVLRKGSITSSKEELKEKTKLVAAKRMVELEINVEDFVIETKKCLIIEYIYFILVREFTNGKFNKQFVKEIVNEIELIKLDIKLSLKYRMLLWFLRKNPIILYWIYKMKGQQKIKRDG
ncbi:glycosyltransferase family 2 protein [Ureibacillus sinduriensis]|uniref:glycosyltransferase family 2 protein n=1 Tax=Ureibacillus sinduriensis TaxID=561440 RepID=UPI00068B796E|nr:glycosyltransferase family 2 protein [Ureibacillus sinduriensis]